MTPFDALQKKLFVEIKLGQNEKTVEHALMMLRILV
jgi:hypothetical protein